jgi:hypothetical protein
MRVIRYALRARAAGWWRLEGDRLELVGFSATEGMPEGVARRFAEATRSVPLSQTDLGIVRAALQGEMTVSSAEELPPGTGSGLWLRRFGAARSVAVPIRGPSGAVSLVVSVALSEDPPDDQEVVGMVNAVVTPLVDPSLGLG